jgi:uncharacterized protein (DUF3820 family)
MSFDLSEYVDVAERIGQFKDTYPDGVLQAELVAIEEGGKVVGWLCKAYAYRTADDPRPGVGHAVERVPGSTPYTRDSEAMNSETHAWGRAIVALGFRTKKIASTEEVLARQSGAADSAPVSPSDGASSGSTAPDSPFHAPVAQSPDDLGDPSKVLIQFGKHAGKTVGQCPEPYLHWLAGDTFEGKTKEQRRVKLAAQALTGQVSLSTADDGIPF